MFGFVARESAHSRDRLVRLVAACAALAIYCAPPCAFASDQSLRAHSQADAESLVARASCALFDCREQVVVLDFHFAPDSVVIGFFGARSLDALAAALADPRLANRRFQIDGHADARGDTQQNLALTQRRADAATAYLVARGVDPTRLLARGVGADRPLVNNPYAAANRGVGVRVYGNSR